jgi:twitching motility two-component system response regulator PilH
MARILIVDDSPSQLVSMKRIVEKLGHEALTAEDGASGVEVAKAQKPDLILMDVVMPGQNGFQFTRALTRDPATQAIPIIICTSKNQQTDRIWALRQGARDFVSKPVQPDELLGKIAALG